MDYLIVLHTGSGIRTLTFQKGDRATIGGGENDTIRLKDGDLGAGHVKLRSIGDGVQVLSHTPVRVAGETAANRILSAGDVANITEQLTLAVFEGRCDVKEGLSLASFKKLHIGRSRKNDLCLRGPQVSSSHATLQRKDGRWFLKDAGSRNGTFVGGKLLGSDAVELGQSVPVFMGGFLFEVHGDILHFQNTPEEVLFSPAAASALLPSSEPSRPYPDFYRSPRLRAAGEKAEVEVLAPPSGGTRPAISWLQVLLPPGMMALVMLLMATFMRNTSTLFYTLPMSAVGVFMAVINYKTQMKKWQQTQGLVQKKYAEHLMEKEDEATVVETSYLTILSSSNPGVRECVSIAKDISRRLWERTPRDSDFLSVRLGTGQTASNVSIKIPKEQLVLEENPFLKEAAKLRDRHTVLHGIPICHSFLESPITGLVGNREDVQKTAWMILTGIATHHSYEDVRIICVYPEEEKDRWEWTRWLPHVWNPERTRRFMACTRDKARPMLRELAEMLKVRRRETSDQSRETTPKTPFYFLLLADKALVECSGETFLPESSRLGFAALYSYGDIGALPGECQAIIECGNTENKRQGVIRQTSDAGDNNVFTPDPIQLSWMDDFARALAPVRVRTSGGSGIPTSVTFLQGLGAQKVEDLSLLQIWENQRSYASLATPIGVKENGDVFAFDIHEKAMGVHGLVAGTSGSGKSEMLTAWLLSMAAHFSPEDVNFLLIEFKGNDLSNILKTLPHVAGVVSNLQDSSSIERSLRSLKGEIARRQRIFESVSDLATKAIFEYQRYQKTSGRKDLEPLPYLITVLDEFAELKTQFPEMMDEFNSVARIGRSLGIYMVLATQSPGGIITPQMDANSRFRICLRTANTGESKEIIGTTDAFFISSPGRAYIKVGDSIYEQVQTFYSKATYNPNAGRKTGGTEINLVELDGHRIRPETYDKTVGAAGHSLSEGQVVVRYIVDTAAKNNVPRARPVWTDPLPEQLALDDAATRWKWAFQDGVWEERNSGLSVIVGRVDDPEMQRQYPFVLDFMNSGHQILYGAPSSGKTTFLQTALLSAALSYTPEQVQFLVMDFGNWGMKIFEGLPHMLMVADASDKEKVQKAEEYLIATLDNRRRLFAAQGVGTLEAYREVSGQAIPAIIVAVDNMAALYNQYPDTLDSLIQIAREGGGLGVYLLLTAGNPGSFMFRIAQYVKSNHALQLTDRSDYRALVGGTGRQEPGHFAGRGFTKGPLEFQTALCVEGATEGERVKQLRAICSAMTEAWKGKRASLEEEEKREVSVSEMSFSASGTQIGINKVTKEPVEFDFSAMNGCVISGVTAEASGGVLGLIARAASQDMGMDVYVCEEKSFIEKLCPGCRAVHDAPGVDAMISELADEFDRRGESEEIGHKRIALFIDSFLTFYRGMSQESADILDVLIRSGGDLEIHVYIACNKDDLAFLEMFKTSIKPFQSCLNKGSAIVAGGKLKEYMAFNELHNSDDVAMQENEGCLIHGSRVTVLKLAKLEAE